MAEKYDAGAIIVGLARDLPKAKRKNNGQSERLAAGKLIDYDIGVDMESSGGSNLSRLSSSEDSRDSPPGSGGPTS